MMMHSPTYPTFSSTAAAADHRCTQHVGYYPYGLPHRQADGQPRLCESQELQTALNLNQYRYLARTLRPDLAIWTTPDPLAPKYPHLNPYTYCASSPTIFTDPTGTDFFVLSDDGHLEVGFGRL